MAWLSSAQALIALGIRQQTLYANVSRQKIRTRPDPRDPRRNQYHADDVGRLAKRHAGRRRSAAVAAGAIGWGEPVLETQISTVAEGRLIYRGQDAVQLAETSTLEDVAGLLWQAEPLSWRHAPARGGARWSPADAGIGAPVQRALLALAALAGCNGSTHGMDADALRLEAARVLQMLADALLAPAARPRPLHERLARAWGRPEAADALRRALVLLADHELNASTFATRVTASTGASLAASVLTGLATLTGPAHGGASSQFFALLDDADRRGAADALRDHIAERGRCSAFGHPLYPGGDVRAAALLNGMELPPGFAAMRDAADDLIGDRPNIDFALAALTRVWQLPEDAPLTLFALSRCVGWLAHAMEQIATGALIRPRARYAGTALAPEAGTAAEPEAQVQTTQASLWNI